MLKDPGLSTIIVAIRLSRQIFQRMKNYHNNGLLVESMQLIGARRARAEAGGGSCIYAVC